MRAMGAIFFYVSLRSRRSLPPVRITSHGAALPARDGVLVWNGKYGRLRCAGNQGEFLVLSIGGRWLLYLRSPYWPTSGTTGTSVFVLNGRPKSRMLPVPRPVAGLSRFRPLKTACSMSTGWHA